MLAAPESSPGVDTQPTGWSEERFQAALDRLTKADLDRYLLATLRPKSITIDDLTLPRRISRRGSVVAEAIVWLINWRLARGWSASYIFKTAAIGAPQLLSILLELGHRLDRNTVRAGLRDLQEHGVLKRIGQLSAWYDYSDRERIVKDGAYLYELNIQLRTTEDAPDTLPALLYVEDSASLGGIQAQRWLEKWFRGAVERAKLGCRNHLGYVLARRCRDAGLSEGDAGTMLRSYASQVPQNDHQYTLREAFASVRSAYRAAT